MNHERVFNKYMHGSGRMVNQTDGERKANAEEEGKSAKERKIKTKEINKI